MSLSKEDPPFETETLPVVVTEGYKFQYSVNLGRDNDMVNIRANTVTEFVDALEGVAEQADRIVTATNSVRQVLLIKGLLSETKATTTTSGKSELPPPSGPPSCEHGTYKDLGDKGYKHRFYCPAPKGSKQCPAKD